MKVRFQKVISFLLALALLVSLFVVPSLAYNTSADNSSYSQMNTWFTQKIYENFGTAYGGIFLINQGLSDYVEWLCIS